MKIFPFIMAGGIGSRLWPLSRAGCPKQFLPLASGHSMLQDTLLRLKDTGFEPPAVICNQEHRFLTAEHIRKTGLPPGPVILEAEGRGTAFTVAIAALSAQAQDPNALILILPCDHYIEDTVKFHAAIQKAAAFAEEGHLTVFGVPPDGPHTGYGYIRTGQNGAVLSFTEKPDEAAAARYLESGEYLWNAGLFLFPAARILEDLETYAPEILNAARESWKTAQTDLDFLRLPEDPLKGCPSTSIDYAVLEKAQGVKVVPLETNWSDMGSWRSVYLHMDKDAQGNAVQGDAVLEKARNCLIRAPQDMTVSALGVENIAVIADADAVLVADLSQAENVSAIVKTLAAKDSTKHRDHRQVWRPWGSYTVLGCGPRYLIKRLSINPGAALSLQYHNHRAEHWVVVTGEIEVRKNEETLTLKADESVYIPVGAHHRIENKGARQAELIEVQTGDILEESDIVRLEDIYRRI